MQTDFCFRTNSQVLTCGIILKILLHILYVSTSISNSRDAKYSHILLLLVAVVNSYIKAPFVVSFYSPAAHTKLRVNLVRVD